jgi:hypothetical protein
VSIQPFLANQAFDPDQIAEMSAALKAVCEKLGVTASENPATRRLLAKTIIELAQRGIANRAAFEAATLAEFGGE